jgi:hypothetical protein
VKYTLAIAHAADADPAYRGLYLAAAQRLADWWATQPDDGFLEHASNKPHNPTSLTQVRAG